MKPVSFLRSAILAGVFLLAFAKASALRADPPKILEFRTQEVNQKLYFHLRLERPADMTRAELRLRRWGWDPFNMDFTEPSLRPRFVPQDAGARLVYTRERMEEGFDPRFDFKDKEKFDPKDDKDPPKVEPAKDKDEPKQDPGEKNGKGKDRNTGDVIEVYGVFTGKKATEFLLLYPKDSGKNEDPRKLSLKQLLDRKSLWAEEKITLDPAKAKTVAAPNKGRDVNRPIDANDLEGNWAFCQAQHFALLESQTTEFGFYSFGRETTARVYKVRTPQPPWRPWMGNRGGGHHISQLYEVTTGAAAITESLALQRMRDRNFIGNKAEPRTVPIDSVRGVDIDEHPWVKMMGDKKPAPEPLAKMIPHDNYYITFRTFAKFLETTDLLDQWGTSIARAYEVNSRDHRIKQKIEQQICLKSTGLARIFGPAVIKSLAITGNDPYLREGSDLSIIFQVSNGFLFDAGTTPNLDEAKTKWGKALVQDKQKYAGITINSYVTPLREVSLYRASFDGYQVFSNSGVAMRRIIDAHQNKAKRLADSLDFQYMRTVFRADDKAEDGFIFLSDAFIRNLVGPQVRIKERRRLEAMTSLHMVTSGAMYTAWETGKPAQSHDHILATTGMDPRELFSPDGNAVVWNAEQKIAVSSFFNTQHFATPLVEIPIDKVTQNEAREYSMFRDQYMGLWRQFFDPIGIRLSLAKDQVKTEIYILPLVRTPQYNELRRVAGNGTIKLDSSFFSDKALVQYLMHLSPDLWDHGGIFGGGFGDSMITDLALRSWLGDWFTVRLDDSPVYGKLLERHIRREMFPEERHDFIEDLELAFQMPLVIGFDIRSPLMFAGLLTGVRKTVENTLPGVVDWTPLKEQYKGAHIVRIKANGEQASRRGLIRGEERRLNPEFFYAMIDGGFYLSFQEAPIKDIIDRSVALKEKKDKGEKIEVNTSLHFGPKAAVQSKELLNMYLEWETHRRAHTNNRLLYALFKSNVVGPQDDSPAVEAAALQYLGFVPVSPDLAPFRYDFQKEEVVNLRHGTVRQPRFAGSIDAGSPMAQMLEEFEAIRADLRLREDGIHTTLTFRKNDKAAIKKAVTPDPKPAEKKKKAEGNTRVEKKFMIVPWLEDRAITIDGDLTDWDSLTVPPIALTAVEVGRPKRAAVSVPNSITAYAAWCSKGILLAADAVLDGSEFNQSS